MKIQRQFTVNISADRVWEILGPQYVNAADWVSSVHVSHGQNTSSPPQNAPCSGRVCETDLGPFRETITHYDEHKRHLAYSAQGEKMPFFVKQLSNSWIVTPLTDNTAQVDMCMKADLLPLFNIVMGPVMRLQMGGIVNNATEELKYFAENGAPHPRKVEAQHNAQRKVAG
ncbi:MAG: SRPBCC family protein [Cyanobacteria bacterium P01_A01_bin.17]